MDQSDGSQSSPENRPASDATDHSLIKRYQGGNQDAATELYLRYAHRLRGLARAQLSADLARHVAVDDIVQSVFGTFFQGLNQTLYDVPAGEELWKLLLVIALHKIRTKGNYHHRAKRDTRRTTSIQDIETAVLSREEEDRASCAFLQMVIEEALESMSAQHRQVVELRMEGFDVVQIAEKMKRSRRTVERLLQQARTKLASCLDEGK